MIKKGFSLLEVLLTLVIISSLLVVSISTFSKPNLDYLSFINEYLSTQTNSIVNKNTNELKNDYTREHIYFNANGNVNGGRSIEISNRNIVIHLGNGYITYE